MTAATTKTAAKKTPDFETDADVTTTPADWEFETVRDESPIGVTFEKPGEQFIGQFQERRTITREVAANGQDPNFDVFVFLGRDDRPYALPSSYALTEAYEDGLLMNGAWVRVTYVKDIDRGTGKNPMKDLRIEVRK